MAATVGSSSFDPDDFMTRWEAGEASAPEKHDLKSSILQAFKIEESDQYVYHAMASVTLDHVQRVISHGGEHGLHAWYVDSEGKPREPPSQVDVTAYTNLFLSTTSSTKALITLLNNAKKGSIRASVAEYLKSKRTMPADTVIPKLKKPHVNPYLDFLMWSCRELEWCGPDALTSKIKQSHHILPIFYLHFGCACPSFESLEAIRQVANKRRVVEIGSGNGYWAYLMRRMGVTVTAVDNGDSLWRTMWISDTLKTDAVKYLKRNAGERDSLLLMVYPQVTTAFTAASLEAYKGTTICVVGTQNANGFTAFKDAIIDDYMERTHPQFKKILQIPILSFAGKDEALFIFQKG